MSKGSNQKLKLSYLTKIMLEKTDDEHSLTMSQIMKELEYYDVTAERKSIYADFADMTDKLGIEIIKEQIGRETYYRVGSRDFELAEVKLLIDAIQSSKFITQKKSNELIKKIKGLVSTYQASQLQRQVFVQGRIKTMNETIYYGVDEIHNAIAQNKKIRFKYYKWDINKQLVPRHNGDWFIVSPWALTWDDENYYLVAFDDVSKKCKHYRVDKMMKISVIEERREGKEIFDNFNMADYSRATFGMYSGQKTRVKIEFPDSMCGVFIDRFGSDIRFRSVGEGRSELSVEVAVSPQFFGWIFSLGKTVKVTGPKDVTEQMKDFVHDLTPNYDLLPALYKSVLDQDTAPVVICDMSNTIVYMNAAAINAYEKYGGEKLMGSDLMDCHNVHSQEKIKKVVEWFMQSPDNNQTHTVYEADKNTDVYMVALRDEDGHLIGYYEKHEKRDLETERPYRGIL